MAELQQFRSLLSNPQVGIDAFPFRPHVRSARLSGGRLPFYLPGFLWMAHIPTKAFKRLSRSSDCTLRPLHVHPTTQWKRSRDGQHRASCRTNSRVESGHTARLLPLLDRCPAHCFGSNAAPTPSVRPPVPPSTPRGGTSPSKENDTVSGEPPRTFSTSTKATSTSR